MTDNNARVTTFTYSEPPSVEPGWYPATLYCVEIVQHKLYGERWRWVFTIKGAGDGGKDVSVSKWTSPYLSKKSKANEIVESLRGRPVTKGETFDFAELQDKPCMLDVLRDDEGYNQVKSVAQPQAPAAPAVAAALDPEYAAFLAAKQAKVGDDRPANVTLDEIPF